MESLNDFSWEIGNSTPPAINTTSFGCEKPEIDGFTAFVGILLTVGILASFVPQYISILLAKSSEGLNYFVYALGFLSGITGLINVTMLKWESHVMCCNYLSLDAGQCLYLNLPITQLAPGPLGTFVAYVFVLHYFPFEPSKTATRKQKKRSFLIGTIVLAALVALLFFVSGLAALLYYVAGVRSDHMITYARICGIISAIAVLIMWLPQLWTTFRSREIGTLSIPMLLLQIPGAFLIVYFQAVQSKSDITTWGPYVIQGIEQSLLLAMCIVYWIRDRRRGKRKRQAEEEASALLSELFV
mmetsp:Transcript_3617/g.4003  ORF Transcript_3617/g.4003 Transcript_3617/m.4003 type:complete len:300 (-) Transcript_3617:246-1145(-)